MRTCKKCGQELQDVDKVCPNCAEPIEGEKQEKDEYVLLNEEIITQEDIEKNKLVSVLSYLSLLILIPLFVAPESKYARFHIIQGINLLILEVIYAIISCLLSLTIAPNYVFGLSSGPVPIFIIFINTILGIFITVLSIIGIINAATGKIKELPIIGKIKIIK